MFATPPTWNACKIPALSLELGAMDYAWNPSIPEAEIGGLPQVDIAWATN